jgi:purine nucleoside phosphorylase
MAIASLVGQESKTTYVVIRQGMEQQCVPYSVAILTCGLHMRLMGATRLVCCHEAGAACMPVCLHVMPLLNL